MMYSFQDHHYLYMVMEFLNGGDLMTQGNDASIQDES